MPARRAGVTVISRCDSEVGGAPLLGARPARPLIRLVSVAAIRTTPVAAWQSATSGELWRPDLSAPFTPQLHGVSVYDLDGELAQFPFGEVSWVVLFMHGIASRGTNLLR